MDGPSVNIKFHTELVKALEEAQLSSLIDTGLGHVVFM